MLKTNNVLIGVVSFEISGSKSKVCAAGGCTNTDDSILRKPAFRLDTLQSLSFDVKLSVPKCVLAPLMQQCCDPVCNRKQ